MSIAELKRVAREKLYADEGLGCGNFLFKAHALSPTPTVPFLFLERPFVAPSGNAFREFSLNTLYNVVRSLAECYASLGVRKGDVVATMFENGVGYFIHYLALNSLGAAIAILNAKVPAEVAAQYLKQNGFKVLVFDSRTDNTNVFRTISMLDRSTGLHEISVAELGGQSGTVLADWPVASQPDDTVMICHSSGTTNIPKAIVYTHRQHFIGKRERLNQFIEQPDDRMFTAMPPAHSAGISYLMTAVMCEVPTFVPSTLVGPTMADHVLQFRPTIMTGFAQTWTSLADPDFLYPGAFSFVRRFYNTGDTPHEKHVTKLLRLAPKARFTDGYGSSELAMAQFEKISTANNVASKRCVGRPRWFVEDVKIVDACGQQVPDNEVGYIVIKSPTLTPGYYNQPQLTQLARLDGYWITGDVGYKSGEEYYQVDRSYDMVTTASGPLYSLATEEFVLQEVSGIHDAVVGGVNRFPLNVQSTVAIIVAETGKTVAAGTVLDKLRSLEQFDRDLPSFSLCAAITTCGDAVPVGCTGKVLKRTLRDTFWDTYRAYLAGDRRVYSEVLWNEDRRD